MTAFDRNTRPDAAVALSTGFGAGVRMAREAARMDRAVATMLLALSPALASIAVATFFAMPA